MMRSESEGAARIEEPEARSLGSKERGRLRNFLRSSLLRRSAVAAVDQGLLSGLNFLITITLIRTVPKAEYGYYAIAFSVILFLVSVQNAVSTTPLTVLLVTKKGESRSAYVRALCWGQLIVLIPATFLGLIAAGVSISLGVDVVQASIAGSLCLASTGILLREFSRAYLYAEEMPLDVLRLDACYVAIYLGMMALALSLYRLSVPSVIILGGLSGAFVFSFNVRRIPPTVDLAQVRRSYSENWRYGRWSLLGVVVTHIQKYSYLYLLGVLMGSMAVADVSAARLLLMPFVLLQAGWGSVTLPHGARLREARRLGHYVRELVLASAVVGVAIIAYAWLILSFSGHLERFLLTEKYQEAFDYILPWSAVFAVTWVRMNAGFGLMVIRRFDAIAKANLWTMIVTIVSAFVFIKMYGIKGALASLLIGEVSLACLLWWILVSHVLHEFRNPSR
jgi:O-antigen/teichoic acid export membrane protein